MVKSNGIKRQMIILATHNSGKIKEFKRNLTNITNIKNLELLHLKQLGVSIIAEESGVSFEENAKQKLSTYFEILDASLGLQDKILISEDSGLKVSSLNGEPGIQSARYGGKSLTDAERVEYLLDKMKEIQSNERNAQFVCVIAVAGFGIPVNKPKIFKSEVEGSISSIQKGTNGFGYDPVFINLNYKKTNAELNEKEKDRVSHRGLAIQQMIPFLEKL